VHEYEDVPAFNAIVANKPDIFVWLGDMVYGDTEDMSVLKKKYNQLKGKPEYQKLINTMPVIGVWDDHDYGVNDGNKYYPKKDESKQLALDFLDAPKTDPRYDHDGLYSSYTLKSNKKLIKIILLDTRYFQDSLQRDTETRHKYLPNKTGDILGEAQWKWLEKELANNKTDLFIIGSGIQLVAKDHYYEKWANFPAARVRMLELLKKVNSKPLLFISGDRHIAEISKMNVNDLSHPLIDFTASGLTHTWKGYWEEPNEYRIGELIVKKNYGLLKIEWEDNIPTVSFEVRGVNGENYMEYSYKYNLN
jgi:alkaline phosphatase D